MVLSKGVIQLMQVQLQVPVMWVLYPAYFIFSAMPVISRGMPANPLTLSAAADIYTSIDARDGKRQTTSAVLQREGASHFPTTGPRTVARSGLQQAQSHRQSQSHSHSHSHCVTCWVIGGRIVVFEADVHGQSATL